MSLNQETALMLREIADLLAAQHANPFRVSAYRRAANTVAALPRPVRDIIEAEGITGLTGLPGVGGGIARSIYEYVTTGEASRLNALKGEVDPVHLFERIPGVGPVLAKRIYDSLHVSTLEALELAAYNGRLASVPGIGPGRAESIQAWLTSVLGKRLLPAASLHDLEPPVSTLLDIDRRYRTRAEQGRLPKIAPKRFNPDARAWLPILHASRGEWHFTALFSNTRRAHELGRTRDWVVIYFFDRHHHEGQCTVVTEQRGELAGKRVVRGREVECRAYYDNPA